MTRRSLTLLESMIVLVLLAAMAALIFPSMLRGMEERTFESAADATNEQLMLARAHAQATGSPVEVTYRAGASRLQARLFMPWLANSTNPVGSGAGADAGAKLDDINGSSATEEDTQSEITESWASREIGRTVRIGRQRPVGSDDESQSGPAANGSEVTGDFAALEQLGQGQDVRLAVFMPDGSALMAEPVWLNDDKGRVGMLTINPWSGLPLFQRLGESGVKPETPSEKVGKDGATDSKSKRDDKKRSRSSSEKSDDSRTSPASDQPSSGD